MKVTPVKCDAERSILIGMITRDAQLRAYIDRYSPEYFSSNYMRIVADWCISYFNTYQTTPKQHIQDLFTSAEVCGQIKADQVELIRAFLTSISTKYDQDGGDAGINDTLKIKGGLDYFRLRELQHRSSELQTALASGDVSAAEAVLLEYKTIESPQTDGYALLNDVNAQKGIFEASTKPLFHFEGALGGLLNHSMVRDSLIGVMAPEKSGKTFLLTEIIKRACIGRCNAAIFELGDMSEPQINRRFLTNLCGKPNHAQYVGENIVPMPDCLHCQMNTCPERKTRYSKDLRTQATDPLPIAPVDYVPCPFSTATSAPCPSYKPAITRCRVNYPSILTEQDVTKACKSLSDHMGSRQLRFQVAANDTTSAEQVNGI